MADNALVYRFVSGGLSPNGWRDVRGWAIGRGWPFRALRLLPALLVLVSAALDMVVLRTSPMRVLWQLGVWALFPGAVGTMVLITAAVETARCWQDGRMAEWLVTPLSRRGIADHQVGAWLRLAGAGLLVECALAAGVWGLVRGSGWGGPVFAPSEGLALAAATGATVAVAGSAGVLIGNRAHRTWWALALSLPTGAGLSLAVAEGLFGVLSFPSVGGYMEVVGALWLGGRLLRFLAVPGRLP